MVDYVRFAESQFDVHGHLPPMLQGIKGRDSGDIIGWRTPPQRVDVRALDCRLRAWSDRLLQRVSERFIRSAGEIVINENAPRSPGIPEPFAPPTPPILVRNTTAHAVLQAADGLGCCSVRRPCHHGLSDSASGILCWHAPRSAVRAHPGSRCRRNMIRNSPTECRLRALYPNGYTKSESHPVVSPGGAAAPCAT
jgi:hypothetical protein